MLLRIINYTQSANGIPRFMGELIRALVRSQPDWDFEFVSHGPPLEAYRRLLIERNVRITFRDIAPVSYRRNVHGVRILGLPGTWRIARLAGFGTRWHYEVPKGALNDCDVVWFPSLHLHQLAQLDCSPIIGTLHDTIGIDFEGVLPDGARKAEVKLARSALKLPIKLVVDSVATSVALGRIFGAPSERLIVIPPSGEHESLPADGEQTAAWTRGTDRFLLCTSSLSPHKNHERLFEAVSIWRRYPLVLTADLSPIAGGRSQILREYAIRKGLRIGRDIIPTGFVPDPVYSWLLNNATALVIPSLAEGWGFPATEAAIRGLPVVCSDIPAMREQMDSLGVEALFFQPDDAADLVRALSELDDNYERYRARAISQIKNGRRRSWDDVAADYWLAINSVLQTP